MKKKLLFVTITVIVCIVSLLAFAACDAETGDDPSFFGCFELFARNASGGDQDGTIR